MRLLFTDNNFQDDAQLERRLAADESVELVVASCCSDHTLALLLAVERRAGRAVRLRRVEQSADGDQLVGGSRATASM